MAETLEEFFARIRDARNTITTPTVLERDDFKNYVRSWVTQTYGIKLEEAIVTGDGYIAGSEETNTGKLINKIVDQWPDDLLIEELAINTNWANAAKIAAGGSKKFANAVTEIENKWMSSNYEGELVRNQVEQWAVDYGWDENLRQRTVDVYKQVLLNEPISIGIIGARGIEGIPASDFVNRFIVDLEVKASELVNPSATSTSEGLPPVTTQPSSDAGTPSPTTTPTSGGAFGGQGVGTPTGGVTTKTVQEFFDTNPAYDFMSSLRGEPTFGKKEYQYFGEFATQYGTFTPTSGETWTASGAMTWLDRLYRDDKKNFAKLQDDLRQAGYFDSGLPKKGYLDETTWTAWASFLGDAARNNKSPVEQFIDAKSAMRQGIWDEQVQTNDIATLRANVRDIGTNLIGRALRDDEFKTLLSSIRQWEKDYVAGQTFALGQPESVDINARIEEYISKNMELEYTQANSYETGQRFERIFGNG